MTSHLNAAALAATTAGCCRYRCSTPDVMAVSSRRAAPGDALRVAQSDPGRSPVRDRAGPLAGAARRVELHPKHCRADPLAELLPPVSSGGRAESCPVGALLNDGLETLPDGPHYAATWACPRTVRSSTPRGWGGGERGVRRDAGRRARAVRRSALITVGTRLPEAV